MDKKLFSLENVVKLGILMAAFFTFSYDIKNDVRETIINMKADSRINNARFEVLEASSENLEGRMNVVEKWQIETDAILQERLKIKKK